ncbi:MAG: hypothetical protein JXA03_10685 [Bacteroidales bacterium]|nr:hypothetical protein [Bacteroidales bacterium]
MRFFSRGKFLISSEYLVLKGATALAVPLKPGQDLVAVTSPDDNLRWESYELGKPWFAAEFDPKTLSTVQTTDSQVSDTLSALLKKAIKLSPRNTSFENTLIKTNVGFRMEWGMGSSSSLISNVAWWLDTDPYDLHKLVSAGSGYDVICARALHPIFFKIHGDRFETEKAPFHPPFSDHIYFVYLGKKQRSSESVSMFSQKRKKYLTEVRLVSELSRHIASAVTLRDFEFYLSEHETILSSVLKRKRIKEDLFQGFAGEVKSLGAWGGDFAMVTWEGPRNDLATVLHDKGLDTFFGFDDLVLNR